MPELPEVETVVRGLRHLAGQRLLSLEILDAKVWFESEAPPRVLAGRRLAEVTRRGKYLLLRFEGGYSLLQHLRMTGKMLEAGSALVPQAVSSAIGKAGKGLQVRCLFRFEKREIWFYDTRRFGTLTLVTDERRYFAGKRIAPDPVHETAAAFARYRERLASTEKPVKSALLDQAVIAGVGNIYADEGLHAAGVHPRTPASRVPDPKLLWDELARILAKSIERGGSTIRDYVSADGNAGTFAEAHLVYDRAGEPCRRCGTAIQRIKLGGRSTHFCPSCQPGSRGASARTGGTSRPKAARSRDKARRRPR